MNSNQESVQNTRPFLKTIIIIYGALLVGQLLFGAVTYSIAHSPVMILKPHGDELFYLVPIFVVACGIVGNILFNKRLTDIANIDLLKDKLSVYQGALIVRYAFTEGATLFAIVSFMLGENLYYLVIAGLNIFYFLLIRPTKHKMYTDLGLNYQEQFEL